jgi:hypothetical protein
VRPPLQFPGTPLSGQEPADTVNVCPVCGGKLDVVYERHHMTASVCEDCHTGISIPTSAWTVAKDKRNLKWRPLVGRRHTLG